MTTTVAGIDLPKEVADFAKEHQIQKVLQDLYEAVQRLFPTAREIATCVEPDPELPITQIIFDIDVPIDDIPDYVKASSALAGEVNRLIPHFAQEFFNFRLRSRS